MNRVTFYIDGFNFYYGLRTISNQDNSWKKFYWLDVVKFCSNFLGEGQELVKVKYFSAPPLNRGKARRQSAFFGVNLALNPGKFKVINGKYYRKPLTCPSCQDVREIYEEKRTDVNISTSLIGDAVLDRTDQLVLISADSDLVPPIMFLREHFRNKRLRVYFPPRRSSQDLLHSIKRRVVFLENNKRKFAEAELSDTVVVGDRTFTRPPSWR